MKQKYKITIKGGDEKVIINYEMIASERKKQKISQIELAKKCGIERSYLSKIENGLANPSINILTNIVMSLNLKLNDFISKETI